MKSRSPKPLAQASPASADPSLDVTCDFDGTSMTDRLVRILDHYLDELKAGRKPDRETLIRQHPELAQQLEACLAGLDFIHHSESGVSEHPQRLGDYRIIREVGRGGMGAVFEAEQISLGRRVALKVLRFGGVSDPEALERFQREAETVANLHHTNIVPIFAVGSERGVNFYAMQFIEGRSLSQLLTDRQSALPPDQVAQIGLQTAEALAHAHQRGVIHRDVKPSNLIMDNDDRVWLTDFGLARRLDDVTLSLTGALLGTPRYMSPEQAMASTKKIDHRSDLFSLGASLYELLLAQPAFSGESPHDVIRHILSDEPTPLRAIDPSIPRDLETIVMKCLAKDPQNRYAAASDLADDLRAYLDGRPIGARRSTQMERATRWLRQNRRSAMLATTVAAATILISLLSSLGVSQYNHWRQAALQLNAVRPPVVAEIASDDRRIERIDTLPMQKPIALVAGDYQVRLSSEGKLSQTYALSLQRGHTFQTAVSLDNQYLMAPRRIERTFDVVDLGPESAVVLWNQNSIALQKFSASEIEWQREIKSDAEPFNQSPGFSWAWSSPEHQYSGYGDFRYQPWVVNSFIDVNQDGIGDIVAAARHQAWSIAISGSDGSVLWYAPRGEQLAATAAKSTSNSSNHYRSSVIHEPIPAGDVDGDQVLDFILALLDLPPSKSSTGPTVSCHRWIEAISGADGKTLWRYELKNSLFDLPQAVEAPRDLRWFFGGSGGMSSAGRNSSRLGKHIVRSAGQQLRHGSHAYLPAPIQIATVSGNNRIVCVAGTTVVQLDPATGNEFDSAIDLGARAGKVQCADLDGDGADELILLEEIPTKSYPPIPTAKLHVWSLREQKSQWNLTLDADWPVQPSWTVDPPQWPLVVDLESDGKHEILVPHRRSSLSRNLVQSTSDSVPWGNVVLLEGSTGQEIWHRELVSVDSQVDRLIAGPDLNGDGKRELLIATLAGSNFDIYVDALSGADGKTCWTNHFEPRNPSGLSASFVLDSLKWWDPGPDGWPQLLVTVKDDQGPMPQSLLCVFSAGTGVVNHFAYGLADVVPVDLDKDGLQELLTLSTPSSSRCDFGGELSALRGVGRQPWKRFAELGEFYGDLNQDGIRDAVDSWGDGTLLATSGATGKPLWKNRAVRAVDEQQIIAAVGGDGQDNMRSGSAQETDLDGDGVGDLLVCDPSSGGRGLISPLYAVSGRSGRLLWTLSDVNARLTHSLAVTCVDLNHDGAIEVAWLAALDHQFPSRFGFFSSNDTQLWLFVASGKTGRLLWSQALSPQYGHSVGRDSPYQFNHVNLAIATADLDQDGHYDLLVPAITHSDALELRALSGRAGEILWTRPRHPDGLSQESLRNWTPPTPCDLDQDGQYELAVSEPSPNQHHGAIQNHGQSPPHHVQIALLSGDSGIELWSYNTGVPFRHFRSLNDQRGLLLRPFQLSDGEQEKSIAVLLPGANCKIVVLNRKGQHRELAVNTPEQLFDAWVCEEIRPGVDGLVFLENRTLKLVGADRLAHPVWERPFSSVSQLSIMTVCGKGVAGGGEILVSKDGTDNSVLGISVDSGATVWSCPGPIARDSNQGVFNTLRSIDWLGSQSGQAPLIAYTLPQEVDCRQAVFRTTSSSVTSASDAHFGAVLARLDMDLPDVRWQRPLPWVEAMEPSSSSVLPLFMVGMLLSLLMVIFPIVFLVSSIKQKRFSLNAMLGLPVVLAVEMLAAFVPLPFESELSGPESRFMVAIALSPILYFLFVVAKQLKLKQYAAVMFWFAMLGFISLLCGTYLLQTSLAQRPLLPQEKMDWSGWHIIVWYGVWLVSWIMVLMRVTSWTAKRFFATWCRLRFMAVLKT